MNALKYHWYETGLLSQAALKYVVSKNFNFKKSVQGIGSLSEEINGIVPYQVTLHYF